MLNIIHFSYAVELPEKKKLILDTAISNVLSISFAVNT